MLQGLLGVALLHEDEAQTVPGPGSGQVHGSLGGLGLAAEQGLGLGVAAQPQVGQAQVQPGLLGQDAIGNAALEEAGPPGHACRPRGGGTPDCSGPNPGSRPARWPASSSPALLRNHRSGAGPGPGDSIPSLRSRAARKPVRAFRPPRKTCPRAAGAPLPPHPRPPPARTPRAEGRGGTGARPPSMSVESGSPSLLLAASLRGASVQVNQILASCGPLHPATAPG